MIDIHALLRTVRDDLVAGVKVTFSWVLTSWAHVPYVSSADLASYLAILYTLVQLYVLVRDKILRRRRRKEAENTSDYTTL